MAFQGSIAQESTNKFYGVTPLLVVSTALAITASTATYLLLQLIQRGHLISIPGIGVTSYNSTIGYISGLFGLSILLAVATRAIYRTTSPSCFEGLRFLGRFITNPSQVGAIFPSSLALAVQITDFIPDRSQISDSEPGKRFLEIGAGTGVFTREIVKKLGPHDILDIVEYDQEFCEQLRKEFRDNVKVRIHEVSITDFISDPYDGIVSGLPLNAFEPEFVQQVLKKYEDLTKHEGAISYFEYIALEKIKKAFLFGSSHANFARVLDQKEAFVQKHRASHVNVLGNLPRHAFKVV